MSDTDSESGAMTFRDHLLELRQRMTRIFVAVLVGFMTAFAFKEPLFDFVATPLREALADSGIYGFTAIEITETIFVYLKLSFITGIIATLPYTFYQLWSFIAPGLLEREKAAIAPLVFFSTVFFLLGAYFAYEVIIPFVCDYLANLANDNASITMEVTVRSAFGFSLSMILAFGVAFELPMVMFFLTFLGVADHKKFLRFFRYFVVLSFVIGALFTPPDPISQLLMAGPLNLLYLLGIATSYFVGKRREKQEKTKRIPARVWGLLSATLLLLGVGIGVGTWWLGQTRSPLEWVPPGAQWVLSARWSPGLDAHISTAKQDTLRDQLGIPSDAPKTERVVMAGNAEGQVLVILPGACTEQPPAVGVCRYNDLLLGDDAYVEQAVAQEHGLSQVPIFKALEVSAPMWLWLQSPSPELMALLPGDDPAAPIQTKSAFLRADLRGDAPWLDIGVQVASPPDVSTLQNRVDLWRSSQQQVAKAQQLGKHASALAEQQLSLLHEVVNVQDAVVTLLESNAALSEQSGPVRKKLVAVQEKLKASGKPVDVPPSAPAEDTSVLATLGAPAIQSWRSTLEEDRMSVRLDLTIPDGLDALLSVVPSSLPERLNTATSSPAPPEQAIDK